jgi:PAS domain S-box-containing protein
MTAKVLNMRFPESRRETHTLDRLMLALKFMSTNARLTDTVLLVDGEMNVLYENKAALELIGYKVGMKCFDAVGDGKVCDCCPLSGQTNGKEPQSTIRTINMPDGRTRYLEITANPVFDEYGRAIGSIGIGRDVTLLREADEERKTALSMLSHDLKSPLTAIQGYVELLLDKKGDVMDEDSDMLHTVKKSSAKLLGLVEDFLTLSQIEAGKMRLNPGPVDLSRLVDSHVDELRAVARKRNVRIHTDVPQDLPAAYLDERHSGRVVSNLLHNAIKYCGEGGGIWIRAGQANARKLFLEISDNGPGIPADELPTLFDTYSAAARHGHGTGLGLAIVKALTEIQGGTVEARCGEGTGATIKLTLPAAN